MRKYVTAEAIRQYAKASKDTAPIHLNNEAAAKAGYERPIAHGMYIMGLAQSMYLTEHQELWITDCSMKFLKPLLADQAVNVDYEACTDEICVTVTLESGEVIAAGTFSVKEGLL